MRLDGYSLWLMPQSEQSASLQDWIDGLARRHGTPRFEAHITLCGGIGEHSLESLQQKTHSLAEMASIRLTLGDWVQQDFFYRRIVRSVVPHKALTRAHRRANRLFTVTRQREYWPHLSIMYGQASQEICQQFIDQHPIAPMTLDCDALALIHLNGEPKDWTMVHKIALRDQMSASLG